jgi:outer membrane protein assembly factor BamB
MSNNQQFPPPGQPYQPPQQPPPIPPQPGQQPPGQPPAQQPYGAQPPAGPPYQGQPYQGPPYQQQPYQGPPGGPPYQGPPPGMMPEAGAGGPGGPPGKKSKTGLVITLVMVLIAGVAGAWFVFGDDSDNSAGQQQLGPDPETPGGKLWGADSGTHERRDPQALWLVGDTVVQAGINQLHAFTLADGAEAWSLELEGEHMCLPSAPAHDGRVVIGHGENNCGQNITLVDLNSGEQGWSRRLEPQDGPAGFQIAMAGDSYAIHTHGGWNLHRTDDGEVISAGRAGYISLGHKINEFPFGEPQDIADGDEICGIDGLASSGDVLIRRRTCATVINREAGSMTEPVFRLQQIDPATGDVVWTLDLPDGKWLDKVHSVEPLVVSFRSDEFTEPTDLVFISDGQITAQVPMSNTGVEDGESHRLRDMLCRDGITVYSALDDCGGVAVHGEQMYISPPGRNNVVTALSAATGEQLWTSGTEEFVHQVVVAADADGVIVFQQGYADIPRSQLVRISPDGQQVEPLFQTGDSLLYGYFFALFSEGKLVISAESFEEEEDLAVYGVEGTTEPLPEEEAAE